MASFLAFMKLPERMQKPWASKTGTWDTWKILNDYVQPEKHSLSMISFSFFSFLKTQQSTIQAGKTKPQRERKKLKWCISNQLVIYTLLRDIPITRLVQKEERDSQKLLKNRAASQFWSLRALWGIGDTYFKILLMGCHPHKKINCKNVWIVAGLKAQELWNLKKTYKKSDF